MLKLVDDLLDLARVEAGRFEIDLQETLLNDVIDDVVVMTLVPASEKDVGLEFDIPDSLPVVSADPRRLARFWSTCWRTRSKSRRPADATI